MKIRVLSDNLFVTNRLKEIDKSYYVLYNSKSKKYELHSSEQLFTSYCITFPFPTLDYRAIEFALKSRVANKADIISQMEKENEKIIKEEAKHIKNEMFANLKVEAI